MCQAGNFSVQATTSTSVYVYTIALGINYRLINACAVIQYSSHAFSNGCCGRVGQVGRTCGIVNLARRRNGVQMLAEFFYLHREKLLSYIDKLFQFMLGHLRTTPDYKCLTTRGHTYWLCSCAQRRTLCILCADLVPAHACQIDHT